MKLFAFQLLFYTGSLVTQDKYTPFIETLRKTTGYNVTFAKPAWNIFDTNILEKSEEEFVVIGHSFGGYRASCDALRYPKRVKGVVLLQSHFNSDGSMPYPRIDAFKLTQPSLTILGNDDRRLPIHRALYDLYKKVKERYINHFFIVNKHFDHFAGVANNNYTQQSLLSNQINVFLKGVESGNFSINRFESAELEKRFTPRTQDLTVNALDHSQSFGVIDAILKISMPRFLWQFWHWLIFLDVKPDDYVNHMFIDKHHIYIKAKYFNFTRLPFILQSWANDTTIKVYPITLSSIHPNILVWLGSFLQPIMWKGSLVVPFLHLPINNETAYVKLPSPNKIYDYVHL